MSAAPDILLRISEHRRQRIPELPEVPADLTEGEPIGPADNLFLAALSGGCHGTPATPATPAIIAEVKMGSPRLGSLHGKVDPVAQAKSYAENGAVALSVVVEPDFFHGGY